MISTYDFQLEHPEMFSHLLVKYLRLLHYKYPRQKKYRKSLYPSSKNSYLNWKAKK
jgi:hypothetical protein